MDSMLRMPGSRVNFQILTTAFSKLGIVLYVYSAVRFRSFFPKPIRGEAQPVKGSQRAEC